MDLFTLVARLSLDASDYEKGVQSSKQSFMGLANTVSAKAVAVGTMVAHGVERAAGSLIDFGKNAIQASADIEAEISLYQQVFGDLESARWRASARTPTFCPPVCAASARARSCSSRVQASTLETPCP